ncbi:dTDP-4-dehydrorhamnose reductase [Pseudomonas sp. GD03944]|uniref:dTDP-4-dehydrorhamnose reductase n=1 Tax=Pseudomonas sp. GD03944 TaxID=2975409 RepID=UPI00244ADF59|nr:dTDP-4-dehydrorhamnose reductase [Pseudomonas sp. GD03944]MDH1264570.1 dTDP-4-dehydrorhamnose reductase [Pseudomonas sp. GD03944]
MNILLIGANGQVSRELQLRLAGQGQVIVRGSQQLDLARPEQIRQQVRDLRPDLIINAAAYTAVDQAESERDLAFAINATGPGILAEEAAALGAPLIHYSTDYVFDGSKETAYTEADTPTPLGVYGQSKWAGEQAIQAVGGAHLILRTSWVYSLHGRNFLLTMQRLLQERESLNVVVDQVGAPTWAGSIAQTTEQIIQHWRNDQGGPWGTYHLTAQGEISWFGFASAIAEQLRLQGKPVAQLQAIPSSEYPTPARRPLNSRLDCSRLQKEWFVQLPDWPSALLECLHGPR